MYPSILDVCLISHLVDSLLQILYGDLQPSWVCFHGQQFFFLDRRCSSFSQYGLFLHGICFFCSLLFSSCRRGRSLGDGPLIKDFLFHHRFWGLIFVRHFPRLEGGLFPSCAWLRPHCSFSFWVLHSRVLATIFVPDCWIGPPLSFVVFPSSNYLPPFFLSLHALRALLFSFYPAFSDPVSMMGIVFVLSLCLSQLGTVLFLPWDF